MDYEYLISATTSSFSTFVRSGVHTLNTKEVNYLASRRTIKNEEDTGQVTDNFYILVRRHMNNGSSITLTIVKSIIPLIEVNNVMFDSLLKGPISRIFPPYKLKNNRLVAAIGRHLPFDHVDYDSNRKVGVYIWTLISTGEQYVGSSIFLARRVRDYFTTIKTSDNRSINVAIRKHGIDAFSLTIHHINVELPVFSGVTPLSLVLALEQYIIIKLKPSLNDILVASGVPSSKGILAGNNVKMPVYVYNYDCTELLYIGESQKDFIATMPISKETLRTALNNNSLLLGTVVVSRLIISDITTNFVSTEKLINLLEIGKKTQYLRRANPNYARITSILLTDLRNLESNNKPMLFESKNAAYRYTKQLSRIVTVAEMKHNVPFTHKNDWLVEFPSK